MRDVLVWSSTGQYDDLNWMFCIPHEIPARIDVDMGQWYTDGHDQSKSTSMSSTTIPTPVPTHNFFPDVFEKWLLLSDHRKFTLMLHVDEAREHMDRLKPCAIGIYITRTGWVELGNFLQS